VFYEHSSQVLSVTFRTSCNSNPSGHSKKKNSVYLQMKMLSEHDHKVTTLKLRTFC